MLMKGIKNSLICMAVVVLCIALMDGITESAWEQFGFYAGILLMGILFSVWQIILKKIGFQLYLCEITVNFLGTLLLALILGKLFGWYSNLENVCYVCIEVLIAFVAGYLLGLTKTRSEIELINLAVKKRKSKA